MSIYDVLRPIMIKGHKLNEEEIRHKGVVNYAIRRESDKHANAWIMNRFINDLQYLLEMGGLNQSSRALDVGCGCGDNTARMAKYKSDMSFIAVDIIGDMIELASERYKDIRNLEFLVKNILHESFDCTFDLVTCLETIEHIDDKVLCDFIKSLFKLSTHAVILSVPREPIWCLANMVRFKYWSRLGNTPSHLQHWTKTQFEDYAISIAMQEWGKKIKVFSRSPLKLWTIILLVNNNLG